MIEQLRPIWPLLQQISSSLGIDSNNMIADRYTEPAFLIEGKCTLTTVYRAKGNEAAVAVVMGCDAVSLRSRSGRNRLFTAFTRTKGWLRITGMEPDFATVRSEIENALSLAPVMDFKMPDPKEIGHSARFVGKGPRIQRAREELERVKVAWPRPETT